MPIMRAIILPHQGQIKTQASLDMALPAFNEGALATLTQKIEAGLKYGKAAFESAAKHEARENKKTPRDDAGRKSKATDVGADINGASRGKKRDLRGQLKKDGKTKASRSRDSTKPTRVGTDEEAKILEDILALGGDREDLALMAEAGSESEMEVDAPVDDGLHKELASFVKGLGLNGHVPKDAPDGGEKIKEEKTAPKIEQKPAPKAVVKPPKAVGQETGANLEPVVKRPLQKSSQEAAGSRLVSPIHLVL